MALHSLYCADVPLRNSSLTHYTPPQISPSTSHDDSLATLRLTSHFCKEIAAQPQVKLPWKTNRLRDSRTNRQTYILQGPHSRHKFPATIPWCSGWQLQTTVAAAVSQLSSAESAAAVADSNLLVPGVKVGSNLVPVCFPSINWFLCLFDNKSLTYVRNRTRTMKQLGAGRSGLYAPKTELNWKKIN